MKHIFNLTFLTLLFIVPVRSQSWGANSWGKNDSIAVVDVDAGHADAMKVVLLRNLRQLLPSTEIPRVDIFLKSSGYPDSIDLAGYSMLSYSIADCCDSQQVYGYRYHNQVSIVADGANNPILKLNNPLWPWIRVGTVDSLNTNLCTSYGPGLDFVERSDTVKGYQDWRTDCTAFSESFGTVLDAAKVYYIKYVRDSLCGCDEPWFKVYQAIRQTASNYNPLLTASGRKTKTGWGKINVAAAIAWNGTTGDDYWFTSTYQRGDSYTLSITRDTFPRKDLLTGEELLKTHRNETGGNKEYTTNSVKELVLRNHRNGVTTGTTDGSGDLTITFSSALPDATYSMIVTVEGTAPRLCSVHTKTTSTCKVRIESSPSVPLTATSVTISYEAKDY